MQRAMAKSKLHLAVLGLSMVALLLLLSGGVAGQQEDAAGAGSGQDDAGGQDSAAAASSQGAISYEAMKSDETPGKNKLLSQPAAEANPYWRGCEALTECRGRKRLRR
ncbi:hypothetical protein ACP4OV_007106 [Aristida adscensionis]